MRALLVALVLTGCGSSTPASPSPDADEQPDASAPDASEPDATEPPAPRFLCRGTPPAGAAQPTPPRPYAGTCPTLAPGMNTITSGGQARQFLLVVPAAPMADESLPVLVMWHWLGGSAQSFLERGEVQQAADDQRFLAIIPVSAGASVFGTSFDTKWPFDITQSQQRMDQEFAFFDDMLSCVEQQFEVNQSCVSTVGVSAGALFVDQLAQARSQTLASFISLSGGTGATIIKPWTHAARKLPGVVMWGGDGPPAMDGVKDILGCFGIGMDFSVASSALETGLTGDGHFFIECKHNCGHVEPPLEPPPGNSKFAGMWEFALDHPFWLAAGDSPWKTRGLPPSMPAWCGIATGGATPRSGAGCPPPENPCPALW